MVARRKAVRRGVSFRWTMGCRVLGWAGLGVVPLADESRYYSSAGSGDNQEKGNAEAGAARVKTEAWGGEVENWRPSSFVGLGMGDFANLGVLPAWKRWSGR